MAGPSLSLKQKYFALLAAATRLPHLRQLHAHLLISGHLHHRDAFLATTLLRRLLSLSHLPLAHRFLLSLPSPPLLLYNLLLRSLSSSGSHLAAAGEVYVLLRRRGLRPSEHTLPFLLKSCAHLAALRLGAAAHADAVKFGLALDYVHNTLMLMYSSCGVVADAHKVFGEMPLRTLVSWNTILTACVSNSRHDDCVDMFLKMSAESGFEPNQTTFVVLLSAAAELGSLGLGKWIHGQVVARRLEVTLHLGTALVNVYAKCGVIGYARRVFQRMAVKNVWTWSAMILGFAQHGSAREALELFARMKDASVEPNCVTFLGVLCACSHAGLVDDGYRFFREMERVHGIKPIMSHYSAMVDVLGRNGRLREAYNYIKNMPAEADPVVWRTLLSACQLHCSKEIADIVDDVQQRLLDSEPRRSGNYVMVANIYSDIGLWDKAARVRRTMREGGMKKVAGESCIEVGGRIRRFSSGDDSCDDLQRVGQILDELNLNMRKYHSIDQISFMDTDL